ncbi:hypothetical protein AOQ84DRAFT_377182 [Glonium stellatum]|uniref:Uncharacterized protein n=1 Tax=Glonium stellatum TaxID=574774 RepID=A0A8E2F136_9PEZI|nr:hypothetical protein AOQ84DRAFT_377182 [Glonium stellatum]
MSSSESIPPTLREMSYVTIATLKEPSQSVTKHPPAIPVAPTNVVRPTLGVKTPAISTTFIKPAIAKPRRGKARDTPTPPTITTTKAPKHLMTTEEILLLASNPNLFAINIDDGLADIAEHKCLCREEKKPLKGQITAKKDKRKRIKKIKVKESGSASIIQ